MQQKSKKYTLNKYKMYLTMFLCRYDSTGNLPRLRNLLLPTKTAVVAEAGTYRNLG